MNATKDDHLTLRFDAPMSARLTIRNVFGEIVDTEKVDFEKGLREITAPRSGLIEIRKV